MIERVGGVIKKAIEPLVRVETQTYETAVANRLGRIEQTETRRESLIEESVKGQPRTSAYTEVSDAALDWLHATSSGLVAERKAILLGRFVLNLPSYTYSWRNAN